MQTFNVRLQSEVSKGFRSQRAADSLDINTEKKSIHELSVNVDIESPYSVGLILGASGSGKTTLAKQMFGDDCFKIHIDLDKPIIEQLPESMTYDECAETLSGIGLTSVPCWIRPVKTLSNGQRARAEAAMAMVGQKDLTIVDEWTSVVDRTVAKVMSHCVQKFARRSKKKIILLSCHYDVIEWLNPDWIIDCNDQTFTDRRSLCPDDRKRRERLEFEVREVSRKTWAGFSKYHYLSENLPGGSIFTYGLFNGDNQIGFQCLANYVPDRGNGKPRIYHSNRTVIHPDYAGLGLGILLINRSCQIVKNKGFKVMAKFSSTPIYRSMIKSPLWKLEKIDRQIGDKHKFIMYKFRETTRSEVKTFSFQFVGEKSANA